MLVDLSVKDFLKETGSGSPVPGGGSVSALNAALASALTGMVAGLTIGKKKYEATESRMKEIRTSATAAQDYFVKAVDADAEAYNRVFNAFKRPKETEDEKVCRRDAIQEATKEAVEVPLEVARKTFGILGLIEDAALSGNQNAVTDACVAMMAARTAILGALLNVRINLSTLNDQTYVKKVTDEAETLEKETVFREQALLSKVKQMIG